jgi:acetyltransferase-like isoleucine patch superfamily enzyme
MELVLLQFSFVRALLKTFRACWVRGTSRTSIKSGKPSNHVNARGALLYGCKITVEGEHNTVWVAPGVRLWGTTIKIIGNNCKLLIHEGVRIREGGTLVVEDFGSGLSIGSGTSATNPTIVASEGGEIIVGKDCMLSSSATIRNSDGHAIFCRKTQKRLNPARDLQIGDHTWIGMGARVLRKAQIGSGSVVAAQAVVKKVVGSNVIVAGVPAKVVRDDIVWVRERSDTLLTEPQICSARNAEAAA